MQKLNAKQWPQTYRCKFLTAGLVSYEDSGAGIARLDKETIDAMLESFIGKPVCINHHDITPENYTALREEGLIVGNVIGAEFNPLDGWFYADFIVDTDTGIKCIDEEGYSVSCAYNVLDAAEGGTYQDIKYDGQIIEGSFTHLALVQEPRYEESKIMKQSPMMLLNGKVKAYQSVNREDKDMFKIFKKNAKTGEKELYTGMVVNIDGQEMPVDHLIKNYQDVTAKEAEEMKAKEKEAKEGGKKNEKQLMNDKDVIDINGHKVSIGDMITKVKGATANAKEEEVKEEVKENCASCGASNGAHNSNCKNSKEEEKANASDKTVDLKEDKKEEKENASEDKKEEEKTNEKEEEKKEETKENSKTKGDEFFAELHNAAHSVTPEEGARITPATRSERAQRWAKQNAKH